MQNVYVEGYRRTNGIVINSVYEYSYATYVRQFVCTLRNVCKQNSFRHPSITLCFTQCDSTLHDSVVFKCFCIWIKMILSRFSALHIQNLIFLCCYQVIKNDLALSLAYIIVNSLCDSFMPKNTNEKFRKARIRIEVQTSFSWLKSNNSSVLLATAFEKHQMFIRLLPCSIGQLMTSSYVAVS